jgi:hypothetical protein
MIYHSDACCRYGALADYARGCECWSPVLAEPCDHNAEGLVDVRASYDRSDFSVDVDLMWFSYLAAVFSHHGMCLDVGVLADAQDSASAIVDDCSDLMFGAHALYQLFFT